jgi:hypothetical protein
MVGYWIRDTEYWMTDEVRYLIIEYPGSSIPYRVVLGQLILGSD